MTKDSMRQVVVNHVKALRQGSHCATVPATFAYYGNDYMEGPSAEQCPLLTALMAACSHSSKGHSNGNSKPAAWQRATTENMTQILS